MTLTATSRSVPGTLRQEILVAAKHRLATDEPARLGGDDTAAAPHELLPAALASCIATTLEMYARTKQWSLGGVTVTVDYDPRSTPRLFQIDVRLGAQLDEARLERLRKVAASCPLRRALEAGFAFDEHLAVAPEPVDDRREPSAYERSAR